MTVLVHEETTRSIIGAFYSVYNTLGPGFVELVYASALAHELKKRRHRVAREVPTRVYYDGQPIAWFRLDMVVDGIVALEIKAHYNDSTLASRQLQTYLRATRLRVGLVLQFGRQANYFRVYNEASEDGRINAR